MKKALVIINVSKTESMKLSDQIAAFLKTKGIHTDTFVFDGFCADSKITGYDFVITLGGDGTVLFAARNTAHSPIPIFPVNFGQFGFIASVQPEEWKEELENFLQGKSILVERSMANVRIIHNDEEIYCGNGLNDVVLCAKSAATTISLDVYYEMQLLCKLKADGLIVGTPTGSTAYSAAAGGPILDPSLNAFVLTPINSFSLSSRPIVLNQDGLLSIKVSESRADGINLKIDGAKNLELTVGDTVLIKKYEKKVQLVNCTADKFYTALRSKLNWSGGPHA
ncbi:MAG: NAD(+)/NADH kinase [Treponema sp.]|nr:NAD(+)/NADH kinase [Treponema sp.]